MALLNELKIHELAEMLDKGECSSLEAVKAVIEAIEKKDKEIGAYLSLDKTVALTSAENADKARAKGHKSPLLGVPIAMKDNMNVTDCSCSCASKILHNYTAPYDATAAARLKDAGAVLLGRTNMDEFAMGSTCENSAFQVTSNPWDKDRVPGGSSGGSAAAIAANEAIAALGSDTGGSIRQPAAFCGCVGLKPSYGRVSRYGLVAFASSLDQIGPITKDVRDAAILMNIIAGHDKMDSTSPDIPVPDYTASLTGDIKGVKVGLPGEYFVKGLDADVESVVKSALSQLESLGAAPIDISLNMTEYAIPTYYIIACAEASANLARFDGVRYGFRAEKQKEIFDMYAKSRAEGFGPEVKRRILLGTYVLSSGYYDAYYLRAQKVRTLIRNDFEKAFKKCDVIITPVTPTAAYKKGENKDDPLQVYLSDIFTVPASLAGLCAISVPCGFNENGLPIGLQIIGPAFKEEKVLQVAHAFEQASA